MNWIKQLFKTKYYEKGELKERIDLMPVFAILISIIAVYEIIKTICYIY